MSNVDSPVYYGLSKEFYSVKCTWKKEWLVFGADYLQCEMNPCHLRGSVADNWDPNYEANLATDILRKHFGPDFLINCTKSCKMFSDLSKLVCNVKAPKKVIM